MVRFFYKWRRAQVLIPVIALLALASTASCADAAGEEAWLHFYSVEGTRITNAEGKLLTIIDHDYSGNMNRVEEYESSTGPASPSGFGTMVVSHVKVPLSESYQYTCPMTEPFMFSMFADGGSGAAASSKHGCSNVAMRRAGPNWVVEVSGANGKAILEAIDGDKRGVMVEGNCKGNCMLEGNSTGAVLSGAKGLVAINASDDMYSDPGVTGRFYLRGGAGRAHRITRSGGKLGVSGAWRVKEGSSDHVDGLVARHSETVGTTFLTWNKVRGAKSYRVYRWDAASNRWRAAALRKGKSRNWYATRAAGDVSRFKVRAYRSRSGKGPVGRASAEVWLSEGGAANVSSVKASRCSLRLLAGKSARLSASVAAKGGARPLTGRVRWYSSDPKVASVGRDTGKVCARSKGTCWVWAKAHNGVNSPRVKVRVK